MILNLKFPNLLSPLLTLSPLFGNEKVRNKFIAYNEYFVE
jgi:hypothetical protein